MEPFGDIMESKPDGSIRLLYQNISNLPLDKRIYKSRQLIDMLVHRDIDIMGMSEVGLCWTYVPSHDQWFERIMGKLRSASSVLAWNKVDTAPTGVYQTGGVGMVATDDTSHRVIDRGRDPSGMGRWCWFLLEGQQHHRLRVVSAYRPCVSDGPESVYQQHLRVFTKQGRPANTEPRKAMLDDIFPVLSEWHQQGDQIIVMMDANEDVRTGQVSEMLRLLDMKETILEKHRRLSPPATYNRNTQRIPIDGIWATPGIRPLSAGYLEFGAGCPSDHRALWLDVSFADAFGYDTHPFVPPKARKLNTCNPKLVQLFNERFRDYLESAGLIRDLQFLQDKALADGWSDALEEEYNRIHTLQQTARLQVESGLRRLRMGLVPWSPKLQRYRDTISLWAGMLLRAKGAAISRKLLKRRCKKVELPPDVNPFACSEDEIIQHLKTAHAAYKLAKKDAFNWRDEFLESLAEARAKRLGCTVEQELRRMRQVEQQKRIARNVKRMRGKLDRNATTQVYVTIDGVRHCRTEKEEIEQTCIDENIKRFSQSEGTPPLTEPLLSELGLLGDGPAVPAILAGTYDGTPGADPYAVKLLKEMYIPASILARPTLDPVVSPDDQRKAWKRQKETVSAEPSAPSLSHYKATAEDTVLCAFDASLRSLPAQYGFSPQLWKKITDVEILKKAGVYDIEKMRTITLMHAEFNMNNKKMGREMMANAEAAGSIAREQYGSRKGHRSILAALNKRLTMDFLRLTRLSGALCSTDFKSCYDRIVHSLLFLAMVRQGVASNAVLSMLLTLQTAWHCIRTAFGDSVLGYTAARLLPLMGVGQGNGCGPAGWAVLSTPLIAMLHTAGFGLSMVSALSSRLLSFVCYAFVDDTDVVHTARDIHTTGETLVPQVQRCINHWEAGSAATGAALQAKDKSYWYLIDFRWTGRIWTYRTATDMPGVVDVKEHTGERIVLERLEPSEARETLGVFLAMDGNCKRQVEILREKAMLYRDHLNKGFVSKWEAWYALKSTILKTVEYPMEVLSLSWKQWTHILAPILHANLPKAGFVSSFPRHILFGPPSELGLSIMHPFHLQYLKQLHVVLDETQTDSITHDLLVGTGEALLVQAGFPGHLSDIPFKTMKRALPTCWWADLLEYMQDHNLSFQDPLPTLPSRTSNDAHLMPAFVQAGFRGVELSMLNECRLFLGVYAISHILSMDGATVELWAWEGRRELPDPLIRWPRPAPSLSKEFWRLWQRALMLSFPSILPSRQAHYLLGEWHPAALRMQRWYYDPASTSLFRRDGHTFRIFRQVPTMTGRAARLKTIRFIGPQEMAALPPSAIPCSVSPSGAFHRITGLATVQAPAPPMAPPQTLHEWLSRLPPGERWAVDRLSIQEPEQVVAAIKNGSARAISDGSYKKPLGTSAAILRAASRKQRFLCVNRVPGREDDQSAYRSELAGVVASLTLIAGICSIYNIRHGKVTLSLDGSSALDQARDAWPPDPGQPDFDLLQLIQRRRRQIPITIDWEWIEGHQDDHADWSRLSPLARDNILMDSLAKAHLNRILAHHWRPTPLTVNPGWALLVDGKPVSRLARRELYEHIWAGTTKAYWASKFHWPPSAFPNIRWDLLGEAFGSLPFADQRRTVKLASGHLGVGRQLLRRKGQTHSNCPRCDAPDEDSTHVLLCSDPRASATWATALQSLQAHLQSLQTDPALIELLLTNLGSWHSGRPRRSPQNTQLRRIWQQQELIGWHALIYGFLGSSWLSAQKAYFKRMSSRRSERRWLSEVIKKLQGISWDMWRHRNGVLHHSVTPAQRRHGEVVNTDIHAQFALGAATLRPSDRHWLQRRPVDTVLAYPLLRREQWLESLRRARERFQMEKDARWQALASQRALMANWLTEVS